jgi:hypothetical protein
MDAEALYDRSPPLADESLMAFGAGALLLLVSGKAKAGRR